MKFFLCGESSQNGFSKRCSDLVFPRDAYIKFFKRQGIKMPPAWEDRAKEMADEEKVRISAELERQYPKRCRVDEACILMAGYSIDNISRDCGSGDIMFNEEQDALYRELVKSIKKLDFAYYLNNEVWKNPGNVYPPDNAIFSREAYCQWFRGHPMGFDDPPWFKGLETGNKKTVVTTRQFDKGRNDVNLYLSDWETLANKVIPVILDWKSRPDGARKTAETLLDALNYAAKKGGWGTGSPVKPGEAKPLSGVQVTAIQTLLLPSDGGPGAGNKKSIDLEGAYRAYCDVHNPKKRRKRTIDPK